MADEDVLELADRIWRGETSLSGEHHPFRFMRPLVEVAGRTGFVPSFANVAAFSTDEGLVLVDTGSELLAEHVHGDIRKWNSDPLNTAVYSHGHVDHVFGVKHFEAEAERNGWAMPKVIAHEALPHRFDRYKITAGYNAVINQRQFQLKRQYWPTEFRYPDETYEDHHHVSVGGEEFELHHARGETDDHTWTWVPGRKVLCPGDFFVWASPNAGNPQKVQRYAKEWADAMRTMAGLGAEIMLPGHGFPVMGADRIRTALLDVAEYLESLHDQTLAMMNQGARLDEIIHSVKPPAHLVDKPYLAAVYDEPEFVVRNVWRLYGGWYDGNPATLKPAPEAALASELAELAGGARKLAERAVALAQAGELRLAGHLAELASLAEPGDTFILGAHADVFERRVAAEESTMSKGVFAWAAAESRRKGGGSDHGHSH